MHDTNMTKGLLLAKAHLTKGLLCRCTLPRKIIAALSLWFITSCSFAQNQVTLAPEKDETLFNLEITFPTRKEGRKTIPGYKWEGRLRLFTFPPIWGTTLSNPQLLELDWNQIQEKAAEGNAEAAYLYAHKLIKDQTLYGRAAYLFNIAASRGHAPSLNDMGVLYLFGLGVPRDERKAVEYFRRSSSRGEAMADLNLGLCTLFAIGTAENESQAAAYIESAARKHVPVAAVIMAVNKAVGTPLATRDLSDAYRLILAARVYGSDWPLEEKTSKTGSYYTELNRLENYISQQLSENERGKIQQQMSSHMRPAPPPKQTLKDWVDTGRKPQRHDVVVIGPEPVNEP